jgi:phosphate transport system permease protein
LWARCLPARHLVSVFWRRASFAIMIIPYIAAVMRDVFEQTPVMMKESAYGIGCTTWEVIWRIVLPFTKTG